MIKRKSQFPTRIAALEIGPTRLAALALDLTAPHDPVATVSLSWRDEASALNGEAGLHELTTAFRRIGTELRLAGAPVHVSLSGAYCVTRVVTGEAERVEHELLELEHRSALYLSLGHGPKALAGSIRQIDARQRHALMSVVNQKTLDTIVEAAGAAGLRLARIEPSLVSLCRLVGQLGDDADAPVLVANLDEQGAEIGISHAGQLLLDYRPAGVDSAEQLATVTCRHLARLQRYCNRYVCFARGQLTRLYLCGSPETIDRARAAFAAEGAELDVVPLVDPWEVDEAFVSDGGAPDWTMIAPLGLALAARDPDENTAGPNLMERLHDTTRQPLVPLLCRTLWPLAAALMLAVGLEVGVFLQQQASARLKTEVQTYEAANRQVRLLTARAVRGREKIGYYRHISESLGQQRCTQLTTHVAQCLPHDVWLDSLRFDGEGRLALSGGSFSDDGVYEFVKWLEAVPGLTRVALDGTHPSRFKDGPGTAFDVHCDVAHGESSGR